MLRELAKGGNTVTVAGCQAKVVSKTLPQGATLYAILKEEVSASEELLAMHQQSIRNALANTQQVFVTMIDKLKEMAAQARETAAGSTEGMKVIQHIV
ncbi:MAG: hypothetical protein K6347_00480, partial [Campylobacterales bacterium]